jgi:multiple sugar transport system ATP-binding protein
MVHMVAADKNIVARLDPHSSARAGSTVKLHVDTDNIHLFDSETRVALF